MFSGRGRRVAACTALALSAGMLLAAPASAQDPVPGPALLTPSAPSAVPPRPVAPPTADTGAGRLAAEASSARLSDLDGDGAEDLLYRYYDGELYASSPAVPESSLFDLGRKEIARDFLAIGDQGGATSHPEVLVLSEDGTLTLYADATLDGSGTAHRVGGGWQVYNKITSPGDMNGDGRADLLARTKDGQLYAYAATGDLAKPFGARVLVGGGWGVYDQLVGLGDGNGDGRGDLYARDTTGTLWWYAGSGDPAKPFGTRTSVGGGWNTYTQILRAGDGGLWGRDGDGTLFHYASRGDGTLNGRVRSGDVGAERYVAQFAGAGNNAYTGRDGFVARDDIGTLYLSGGLTFEADAPVQYSEWGGWKGLSWTSVASLDGDGTLDVLQVSGGALYADMEYIGGGWSIYDALAGSGDLSGDGKADILARDKSGVLWLYKGNGLGTALAARVKVGSGWGGYNKIFGTGDHTGDGRADLLARTTGGDLYLYAGTGNATAPFKPRAKIGSGWNTYKHLFSPGDLNADGRSDVLGVTTTGTMYRYLGTTPGKFSGRTPTEWSYSIYDLFS
ncbi:FG-GAP repeat domain-containing protein [Streptomyces sp. NPDC058326]|uniref:FG-GAP repeat domain-containing protein n=1 Tax=Streptomyces sp. NPDC058326 TaxID=3346447 RepID=UPI0036EF5F20